MQADHFLIVILLGGLLGMTGQGIRVIAGIKKGHDQAARAGENFRNNFETSTLLISLLIGFVAGVLATISVWKPEYWANTPNETIMAVIGAGYAGADFVEAFMTRAKLPGVPSANVNADNQSTEQQPAVG